MEIGLPILMIRIRPDTAVGESDVVAHFMDYHSGKF
jgi:hypothetical protein